MRISEEVEKIREEWERRFKEDPFLKGDVLYFYNPEREIIRFIEVLNIKPPSKVLDLGCGNGRNSRVLLERGFDVYGIDFSPSAIEFAKKKKKKM